MTKRRRAEIKALVIAKGGFPRLAERIGCTAAFLYMVISHGTRRGSVELLYKLRDELGVDPAEWPKPKSRKQQSAA